MNYFWNVSKIHKRACCSQELEGKKIATYSSEHSNVGLQDLIFMMNSLEDQKKESLVASFQIRKQYSLISYLKFLTVIGGPKSYSYASLFFESWMLKDLAKIKF